MLLVVLYAIHGQKNVYMSNFFCAGIPAVIVGCVAAMRPSTYDVRAPLTMDIMCGSLNFTSTVTRTRYLISEDINR